jgi:RNA polymerase sigma-70 factor (ECF subfamily)
MFRKDRTLDPKSIFFLEVFHSTKRKLYNFVHKMTFDKMLTEDIVQEVYLKFFESIDYLRSLPSAEIWLFTTARNEIYQYYRKKKIHTDKYNPVDIDAMDFRSGETIEDDLERQDIRRHIIEELIYILPDQKEVFLLKEYGGFSYKEISDMMGIDVELVKSRLHKVRKKLIDRISKIIN